MAQPKLVPQKPTGAFIGASWFALLIGVSTYLVGLWNANMELSSKGYYFTILIFGLFAVISLQKTIRDRAEDIPVTNIYYGAAWFSVLMSLALLVVGLWNADYMLLSEKGFYGLAMLLSLFAVITVQKNVRDMTAFAEVEKIEEPKRKPTVAGQDVPRPANNPAARPN